MLIVIGVDPGKSGAIATYSADKSWVDAIPMPMLDDGVDSLAVWQFLSPLGYIADVELATFVESVHAMPGQGVSSTFRFGMVTGEITGTLRSIGLRVLTVTPQVWKRKILVEYPHDKQGAISYQIACGNEHLLLPKGKRVHHDGIADALCIAEYGWKQIARC